MKYRIVKSKDLYEWKGIGYSARECWDVQRRVLFFFWITVKGFWDEGMAQSYYKALTELYE